MVPVLSEKEKENIEAVKDLIMSEVNVKEINFMDDSAGILVKKIKPDFKKLGPKCGKNMKSVAAMLQALSQEEISQLEKTGQYTLEVEGNSIVVEKCDVEILSEDIPGWLVANNGSLTVALDVTITDELKKEGIARELINRIQNIRKSSGFEITDKINILVESNENTNDAINYHKEYIASQVLAANIKIEERVANATELDFEEFKVNVNIEKA
jgi:isoleucyl-tRNA synthetase